MHTWEITVPLTGEIIESSVKGRPTNEAIKAASRYASQNMNPDTIIKVKITDNQEQVILEINDVTVAALSDQLKEARGRQNRPPAGGIKAAGGSALRVFENH